MNPPGDPLEEAVTFQIEQVDGSYFIQATTGTSGENAGIAVVADLPIGLYLVTEVQPGSASACEPFLSQYQFLMMMMKACGFLGFMRIL